MRSRKRAYPDYITRREHEEFARRMDTENQRLKDENERQNKRITIAEKSLNEFNKLTLEIQRIAASIQQMTEEMSKQTTFCGSRKTSTEGCIRLPQRLSRIPRHKGPGPR